MKSKRDAPPVLLLCGQIAALALARRLGQAGIRVGMLDGDPDAVGFQSRFCAVRGCAPSSLPEDAQVRRVLAIAERLGPSPALIATSDEWLLFMSRHRRRLAPHFRFLLPPAELLEALIDKRQMRALVTQHGLATPRSVTVESAADLVAAARELRFPLLVKSAYSKPGGRGADAGKIRADNPTRLARAYARLSNYDPRLIVQEYIAGDCDRIALYNSYFDAASRPIAVFTGRKLRQYPIQYGTACLSECSPNPEFAAQMTAFFQAIGYMGPVDVGAKFDVRDGKYKILDINPRLGQNYRTYVADNGADLGWLTYWEIASGTSAFQPGPPLTCSGVRCWMIEDNDLRTVRTLHREGKLTLLAWLRSLLRVREFAYWNWRDPRPLLHRFRQVRFNRRAVRSPARPAATIAVASSGEERIHA
jgi:D-aspartate ligase